MKFVKLSVLALTLGIFATSCGGGNSETPKTDTVAAPAPAPAPAPEAPAPAMDTTKKMDSAAAAPATK